MKDKRIKVADNSMVFFDDKILGIDGENLQGKIIFYFNNFKNGVAWLEFEKGDGIKGYIPLNKVNETYELEIKSSLLSNTKRIWMQLRITQDENIKGIPVFKSNKFYMDVLDSINATNTIQEEYPNILDVVNTKQDKLVAGANITIDGNVISATGGGGVGLYAFTIEDGNLYVENQSEIAEKSFKINENGELEVEF